MIRQTNQHDPSTVHPEENGKGTVEKVEIGRVYKVYQQIHEMIYTFRIIYNI